MSSLPQTPTPPAVSLRDVAAQAWARQQAEVAARRRQEIESARDRLIDDARAAIQRAFAYQIADPFSPFTERDIRGAEFFIGSSVELLATRPDCCVVVITFLGERFEWKRDGSAANDHGLIHIVHCPVCDHYAESKSIYSLADLGYWLESQLALCQHGEASS